MGALHVKQIKRRLQDTTYPHVDVSDLSAHPADAVEQRRLTRALAASVLTKVAGLSNEDAARCVTDGHGDNGIDAIAFVDAEIPRLFVVQSKWSDTGKKGASLEDMMKFRQGLEDLIENKWGRWTPRRARSPPRSFTRLCGADTRRTRRRRSWPTPCRKVR